MAPPHVGRGDGGWTPRGMVMAALMVVLAAMLVLSHFDISTAVLVGVASVAALIAVIALFRLPADANGERRNNDD